MLCLKYVDEFCGIRFTLGDDVVDGSSESRLDRRCVLGITLDKVTDDADDKALYMLIYGSLVRKLPY